MRRAGTTTSPARGILERRAGEVLRQRRAVRRRALPDDIHDLRVATRRLQEAIDLMAFALPERERRRVRRRARRIRRGLSEVRDADVLVETIEVLAGRAGPDGRAALLALAPALEARAVGARAAVRARDAEPGDDAVGRSGTALRPGPPRVPGRPARSATGPRARSGAGAAATRGAAGPRAADRGLPVPGLRRRLRALVRALPPVPLPRVAAVAARLLAQRARDVRRGLARARSGRAGDLHRLRIAVKRYRYTLELMSEAGLGRFARAIEAARRLQEVLGSLHDVDVLVALMRKDAGVAARQGPASGAGRAAAALAAARRALAARALATASRFHPVGGAMLP